MPRKRYNTAIRFPAELHDQLVKAAAERDLSVNYLVVKAVEDFLARLIPIEEFTLVKQQYFPTLKGPVIATKAEHFAGYGRNHQIDPPCAWFSGGACNCPETKQL